MAKGFKLKKLLSHYKKEEKYVEKEARRKKKQEEQLEKEAPKVVSSEDLEEAQRRKLKEEAGSEEKAVVVEEDENEEVKPEEEAEEYHSKAMSRKERRKLKKLERKQKEQEQDEEAEEEEQSESENDEEATSLPLDKLAESASESEDEDMEVNDSKEEDENEDEDDDVSEVDDNMTVEETVAKLKEMKERKEKMKKENEKGNELKGPETATTEKSEKEASDVPLSDVEFDSDADVVPHQKLTINNAKALNDALQRIQLPWGKHSFEEHQSVTSETNTDSTIKDIYDDTERELAFYRQSLDAVTTARAELKRLKLPFLRPLDYFAEMVKSDEHMDKIKNVLMREASEKKAREEARKQRQLKKFGKQVQIATLQKRQKEKRETLDRIKTLRKKRQHSEITGDDFDVGIEEATRAKTRGSQGARKKARRGDDDVVGSSRIKVKKNRPGKSRRSRRHH